jgi:hypothetical protein
MIRNRAHVREAPGEKRPRHSHIWPSESAEHYIEPQWCSERLFEVERFGPPGALVLDPACGWGRIPQAARATGYAIAGADIVDHPGRPADIPFCVMDFLKAPPPSDPIISIASNPPFSFVQEFSERALEIAAFKVALLMPLRRLPAARWLERLPLETIYLLSPRPSMPPGSHIAAGHKASGGKTDFCWLVFNKETSPSAPRARWLRRNTGIQS